MPRTAIPIARTAVTGYRTVARDMGSSMILATQNSRARMTYNSNMFVGNTISITSWVKRDILNNSLSCIYGNLTGSSTPYCEYSFEVSSNNRYLTFFTNNGTTSNLSVNSTNFESSVGAWYHMAVTWDGSNVRFYKDAVLINTTALVATPVAIANDYEIGERIGGASDFYGRINEVKVWGRTLTDNEILQDFLGKSVDRTSIAGEWLLNEGTGTTVADTSGNGNDGALNNIIWTTDAPSGVRTVAGTRTAVV